MKIPFSVKMVALAVAGSALAVYVGSHNPNLWLPVVAETITPVAYKKAEAYCLNNGMGFRADQNKFSVVIRLNCVTDKGQLLPVPKDEYSDNKISVK